MPETKESIRSFVNRFVKKQDLADDEDLFASSFVNSLFAMQLVLFVEKTFGVVVGEDDMDIANFRSIDAIADFVARKKNSVGSA